MPLQTHIKQLIEQTGPINMAEFMQLALAHPKYGYYKSKEPFGAEGDFTTAPEISQMFGELIGMWCADIWHKMGTPQDIELVEIGPGRGTLMKDFLRATRKIPGFHESISISMVETSDRLSEIQHQAINHLHPRVKWFTEISKIPNKPVIIVANELFDALPVRQYIKQDDKWHEKQVGLNQNGELDFMLLKSSTTHEKKHEHTKNGSVIEVCTTAMSIIETLSQKIKQYGGAALIIDYGYNEPEYKNTLLAIGNHKQCNLLENIGEVDISAHVDFAMLKNFAEHFGMTAYGPTFQGEFLQKIGIDIRTETLLNNATEKQQKDIKTARDRLIGNNKDQMGELFKVLALTNTEIKPEGF